MYVCVRGDNDTGAVRLSVLGRQPRPRRGFDEGHSAVGELRDHLRGMLRFGSQHHPFERGAHGLPGSDGIAGWQRAAGHCLPHAALDQCGSQDAFRTPWIISTAVVVMRCPPGAAPCTTSGPRLARVAYKAAVRPAWPAPLSEAVSGSTLGFPTAR